MKVSTGNGNIIALLHVVRILLVLGLLGRSSAAATKSFVLQEDKVEADDTVDRRHNHNCERLPFVAIYKKVPTGSKWGRQLK
jgi:hypothetical protein